ncbi:hypothetical protein CC86DRAFT_466738 [Ophiobolus disseminans]|uniref:DUF7730 domain-containing protein n=1 Tax=Ophiobolus disseminans TaxID=1469910 RepID=A0A6A7A140_9PLEO|nr:hypothetical protein CC86DRAFT_466738 [Ophiobolus disseminans]
MSLPNPQPQSPLLTTPYDIRLSILSLILPTNIHLHQHSKHLSFSVCTGHTSADTSSPGKERLWGLTYLHPGDSDADLQARMRRYGRRLQSTWGPHWRCEEDVVRRREGEWGWDGVAGTCKSLYADVWDYIAHAGNLHVTDMTTLRLVLDGKGFLHVGNAFQHVKSLDITLVLPKNVFVAMGGEENTLISEAEQDQAATWMRSGPALASLKQLRKLNVWLDHNSRDYWWHLDESAILSPLVSLANNPSIELTVQLPNQANDDTPISPFAIERRARQENWVDIDDNGRTTMVHKLQFPIMRELEEFLAEDTGEVVSDAQERLLWRRGVDVEEAWRAVQRELNDGSYPQNAGGLG